MSKANIIKAALALATDYRKGCEEELEAVLRNVGIDSVRIVDTPDDTYEIYYWNYRDWSDNRYVTRLKKKLKEVRHALIEIDEYGGIDHDVKDTDSFGCDEVFNDILEWNANILIWGDEPVSESEQGLKVLDIISLISDTNTVKIFDIKDIDNLLAEPIAIYNGKDSIPVSLNECRVEEMNSSVESIDIYIDPEEAA